MPELFRAPGVFVEEVSLITRSIVGVPTSITAFVGPADSGPFDAPVEVHSFLDFVQTFGVVSPSNTISHLVDDFFANGGDHAIVVRVGTAGVPPDAAAYLGSEPQQTGLWALEDVDVLNILCIAPPTSGGSVAVDVYRAALATCMRRRAVLLVDPPAAWSQPPVTPATFASRAIAGVVSFGFAGADARNAALYAPFIQVVDPTGPNGVRTSPPSGAVAGIFSRVDATRGVWKAPAGVAAAVSSVSGLEVDLTDAESGILNPEGINAIRSLPGLGTVVWGARTMAGAGSDYKYVPVRRLTLFIEESLERGTAWAVFEPNDHPLWASLTTHVGNFLHQLYRQGALQGARPNDAYFVRCDATTTTAADIEAGHVNILVGFAPLKPAEFIILTIRQKTDEAPIDATDCFATFVERSRPAPSWEELSVSSVSMRTLRALSEAGDRPGELVLFSGPSGTGKTLAARLLANEQNVDLIRIDLAGVIDKYIGETEKNLERLFTEAAESKAVLFFDEADALFGKRTEVRDSHDRYANLEVSYLLQRIEAFDGLVILATNKSDRWSESIGRRLRVVGF